MKRMVVPLLAVLALGAYAVYLEYADGKASFESRYSADGSSADRRPVNRSADANPKTKSRIKVDTDLLNASTWGHTSTLYLLVSAGANINARATNGDTALLLAVAQGHAETVEAALTLGADVNAKNNVGNTPLIEAVASGRTDVVRAIMARKPDIKAKNVAGYSAIDLARRNRRRDLLRLLRRGTSTPLSASIGSLSSFGNFAAVHQAALAGDAERISALVANGADVNATDANGRTALMIAASAGKTSVVDVLLTRGANPNVTDSKDGRTALIIATEGGHGDVARALLSKGADPNLKDKAGETAMSRAQRLGHVYIGRLLKQAGAKTPSFDQILPKP